MDPLRLSLPEQHNYTDPTVERDVDRLHDWLTNLPLMDVVETVRLVLGGIIRSIGHGNTRKDTEIFLI